MRIYKQEIEDFDLGYLLPLAKGDEYFHKSGEHYRLLAYLSIQLPRGAEILDAGTFKGLSALSLSYNENVFVTTIGPEKACILDPKDNIEVVDGLWQECKKLLKLYSLIFFDTCHDGIQEQEFMDEVSKGRFTGYILFDDIRMNKEMRDFWDNITYIKYDLTSVGHSTGTGLVCVGEPLPDIRI